jgi:vacuolar-type H+-ATPase subunit E/Vma4
VKSWGSIAAVVAAILEDAAADSERLGREADAEMAALGAQPPPAPPPECAAARARAERQIAAAEEEAEWREYSDQLEERERWISCVVDRARARVGPGSSCSAERDRLAALACEAARHLPGSSCTVVVPETARPWLDADWLAHVSAQVGKRLDIESGGHAGGCIVVSEDRRWSFDNSYDARARRSEPEWRAELCRVYDEIVRPPASASAPVVATMAAQT